MSKVAKTKENLVACVCMKCPSYTMGCKMKNMPACILDVMKGISKAEHFEGFFCAFEKSNCIKEQKGCLCPGCKVYKENKLDKTYFCLVD